MTNLNALTERIEKLEAILENTYNEMHSLKLRKPYGYESTILKLEAKAAEGRTRIKEVKFCIKLLQA